MQKLSYKSITFLYVPLALSWVLMLMEAPLVNAFLARGPHPELSLAAYGVAMSIILVAEAPIIMMLELSIALAKSLPAFKAIRRFYLVAGAGVTALGLAVFYTPLCNILLGRVMNIPPAIAAETVPALRIMTWWSFPIGWRRIYQGVLIRDGRTRIISVATGVRLLVLAMTILGGQSLWLLPGASLGALAMVLAVIVEASLIHWAAQSSVSRTLAPEPSSGAALTFRYLGAFYLPLAITTILRQGIRPLISAGIAKAPMAELSLAAWPVAFSLASMFWGPTMGLQQVTIALTEDEASWHRVSRFVLVAGLILTGALALISLTPLLDVVLRQLFGLSEQLARFASPATRIMTLLPLGYTFHALFTGLLVKQGHTSAVRTAKVVNLAVVGLALFAGLRYGQMWGSVVGSVAITGGTVVEAGWLYWRSRPAAKMLVDASAE